MRGRHRAPRTSEDTRLRHRQRVRRGVSILVVTLLATIPVGVSAAMVPQRTVASAFDAQADTPAPKSLADREGDFEVADSLRGAADKISDTTVSAASTVRPIGIGVKVATPIDASCGAGLGAAAALAPPSVCAVTEPAGMNWSVFDPGNIIPDGIFYDTTALTDVQIRTFIDAQGAGCTGPFCLKNLQVRTPDQPADRYCAAYAGGVNEDVAAVLGKVSRACGVNPQVMLVTLQKESGLLGRTDPTASTYDAAWGWHCPDTGPGGSANCDPAYAGFFNQAYGMAKQWSRYRVDPYNYNYRAGQTVDILWNVVESGCGGAPVTITNTATASLYNYTPYQPNAAALASYPGTGDACSAYGNRNFFFLFGKYFGGRTQSGGGVTLFAASVAAMNSPASTEVTIPKNGFVDPALAGRVITAPTASVAAGLTAGFAALGLPYVWGGGGSGAGPNNGCSRGGGALNSCGSEIGFDCSGLTAFVLGRAGFIIPGDSSSQRAVGIRIGWDLALPGDVVGFPGHVAIYLGSANGVRYILEASTVGTPVHIVKLSRSDADPQVYRFWAGIPQIGADGSTFIPASPWSSAGDTASGRTYYSTIPRFVPFAPAPVPVMPVAAQTPSMPAGPTAAPAPAVPAPRSGAHCSCANRHCATGHFLAGGDHIAHGTANDDSSHRRSVHPDTVHAGPDHGDTNQAGRELGNADNRHSDHEQPGAVQPCVDRSRPDRDARAEHPAGEHPDPGRDSLRHNHFDRGCDGARGILDRSHITGRGTGTDDSGAADHLLCADDRVDSHGTVDGNHPAQGLEVLGADGAAHLVHVGRRDRDRRNDRRPRRKHGPTAARRVLLSHPATTSRLTTGSSRLG